MLPGSVATTEEFHLFVLTLTGKSWTHQQILKDKKKEPNNSICLLEHSTKEEVALSQCTYFWQTQMSIISGILTSPGLYYVLLYQSKHWILVWCVVIPLEIIIKRKIEKFSSTLISAYHLMQARMILFHSLSYPYWRPLRAWLGAELEDSSHSPTLHLRHLFTSWAKSLSYTLWLPTPHLSIGFFDSVNPAPLQIPLPLYTHCRDTRLPIYQEKHCSDSRLSLLGFLCFAVCSDSIWNSSLSFLWSAHGLGFTVIQMGWKAY